MSWKQCWIIWIIKLGLNKLWREKGLGFAVYKANLIFQDGVEFADICDIRTHFTLDGKYKTLWRQEVWRPNANKAAVIGDIEMVCLDKNKRLQALPKEIFSYLLKSNLS